MTRKYILAGNYAFNGVAVLVSISLELLVVLGGAWHAPFFYLGLRYYDGCSRL